MAIRMTPAPTRGSVRWSLGVVFAIFGIVTPILVWSLLADWLAGGARPVDVLAKVGYVLSGIVAVLFVLRVGASAAGWAL